jgi:hypothetical protein
VQTPGIKYLIILFYDAVPINNCNSDYAVTIIELISCGRTALNSTSIHKLLLNKKPKVLFGSPSFTNIPGGHKQSAPEILWY